MISSRTGRTSGGEEILELLHTKMSQTTKLSVANNARRLLADAEHLYSAGRKGSALSLAILAIEEAGKYYLLKWKDAASEKGISHRSHIQKQLAAFSIEQSEIFLLVVEQFLKSTGYRINWELQVPSVEKIYDDKYYTELPSETGRNLKEELISWMSKTIEQTNLPELIDKAKKGDIDKIKQSGFYVDYDRDGAILSDPSLIDDSMSDSFLKYARSIIGKLPESAEVK
jgi:AbiV family abortive infection protein